MTNLTKAIDQLQEVVNQLKDLKIEKEFQEGKSRESELLEEARRRGFVEGAKFKGRSGLEFEVRGELFIQQGTGHGSGNIYSEEEDGCIYCAKDNKWAEIIPEGTPPYDQIREGGWEKVIELVGRSYNYCCGTDECGTKVDAYIKLLALSKVLNEGKEIGKYFFKVKVNEEGELYWVSNEICDQPIYFKDHMDIDFALDFAEKEWKIFYNAEK